MRALLMVLLFPIGLMASDADVEAALALAKAKHGLVTIRDLRNASGCWTDLKAAKTVAAAGGKPLVLWVGMTCSELPEVRAALADCVHCHLDVDAAGPGVRVLLRDGVSYYPLGQSPSPGLAKTCADLVRSPRTESCGRVGCSSPLCPGPSCTGTNCRDA